MAQKYDASKASVLNDVEKLRIIAAYLNHQEPNNIDWDAAAAQAGSKSKESYKKMLQRALEKLVSNAAEGNEGTEGPEGVTAPKPTPAPTAKQGRKRASVANKGEDDDGNTEKKAKKPSKPRVKKGAKKQDTEDTVDAV